MPPPLEFAMPVIRPRGTDGYLEMNQNPRVAIAQPLRRMDGPQTHADGWGLELYDLSPTAPERTIYAPFRGYVAYARQTETGQVRVFLMVDPELRTALGGEWRGRDGLVGGITKEFDCLGFVEIQQLDAAGTRATLLQFIEAARAAGTEEPRAAWTLDTDVATTTAPAPGASAPPKLSAWLESNTVDAYLTQYLYSDESLSGLAAAMAAGRRPDAFGLRVNAGDPIGVASTGTGSGGTSNYRIFLKVWSSAMRAMNPGFFFNAVLAHAARLDMVGDRDFSPTNKFGLDALRALTWDPSIVVPPDDASKRAIHPLLWHLGADEHGTSYGVCRRAPATNRFALVDGPPRFVPQAASRPYDDLVAVHASERFANVADIDGFFSRVSSGRYSGFIPWFRARLRGTPPWMNHNPKRVCCGGSASQLTILVNHRDGRPTQDAFARVWNHIPELFGTTDINFVQFVTQVTMMIRETGGTFRPLAERGGISYTFKYNTRPINWTCRRLFSDPLYLFAHGHLMPGETLAGTTAAVWGRSRYPSGYSTDASDPSVAFIAEADFFKFRGRGFIQTTGRANYRKLADYILGYTGSNEVIRSVRLRWEKKLEDAAAAGITIENRTHAALTVSTGEEWRGLFEETDYIFACNALRLFYVDRRGNQRLDYSPRDRPMDYVRRLSDAVSGAACSVEVNTLRVHSVLRALVDP